MKGHEILSALLESFALAAPEADVRAAWKPDPAGRLSARPLITGQVNKETQAGEDWEAALGFTLWLPRGADPQSAESILSAMTAAARLGETPPASIERSGAAVDKNTGALTIGCVFRFGATPGSAAGKKTYTVRLNGEAFAVTGWKVTAGGEELTAVGEDVAFARRGARDTVELQGLSAEGRKVGDGFRATVGDREFTRCRWRTVSAAGGVFTGEPAEGEAT